MSTIVPAPTLALHIKGYVDPIDSINTDEMYDRLAVEGFDTPQGMKRVIEPQEIIAEAKRFIPPDFAVNPRSIASKPKPEKKPGNDPNIETMGAFIPVFGEGDQWDQIQATEIEVYRDLFVPEEADVIETGLARSDFLGTTWHEFGHNAHYTLDYDEMVGWEKTASEDGTAVTWNVKHAREEDEGRGKREDFSDSFECHRL